MKKIFFIALIFVASGLFQCKSQKNAFDGDSIRPGVMGLAGQIEQDDFIGTESVGKTDETSPAYHTRMALINTANEAELIQLLNHPDAEVAATAFEGLALKNHPDLKKELLNLSEGERFLNYIQGDIYTELSLLEYAYLYVLKYDINHPDGETEETQALDLNSAEKAFIRNRILALRQLR